jgi:hypothetical protein
MFKFKATDRWIREAATLEEGCDITAINPKWLEGANMEKLGIANADLLKELRETYKTLKEKEASLLKEGSRSTLTVRSQMEGVREKIDELEAAENGKGKV